MAYAEAHGWNIVVGGSHAWGKMYCPFNDKECRCGEFCIASIWSTPKNVVNHAKQIRRIVDNCTAHSKNSSKDYVVKEFDFTLKFALASSVLDAEQYVERLGEAGCDDAIIGVGQKGRIALEFCRASDNAFGAVVSAIKEVKSVIPDAKLIEAVPDLVGLSDIAIIVGVSRQNIRKLMLTHIHTFPAPIHAGSSSIWHLSDVLQWFEQIQKKTIQEQIREVAEVNMQVNLARDSEKSDPKYRVELSSLAM